MSNGVQKIISANPIKSGSRVVKTAKNNVQSLAANTGKITIPSDSSINAKLSDRFIHGDFKSN